MDAAEHVGAEVPIQFLSGINHRVVVVLQTRHARAHELPPLMGVVPPELGRERVVHLRQQGAAVDIALYVYACI